MSCIDLNIYDICRFENNVQTEESISDILLEAKQIIKNTYKEIDDEDEGVDAVRILKLAHLVSILL